MSMLKGDYSGYTVDLGDDSIKAELGDQLKVSQAELVNAINAANLIDTVFAKVLKLRSRSHQLLLERVLGVND